MRIIFVWIYFLPLLAFVQTQGEEAEQNNIPVMRDNIALIRPDYTLWKMVNVLRSMFEAKAEKRSRQLYPRARRAYFGEFVAL